MIKKLRLTATLIVAVVMALLWLALGLDRQEKNVILANDEDFSLTGQSSDGGDRSLVRVIQPSVASL